MSETTAQSAPATIDARAAAILVVCCAVWGLGLVMVKIANAGITPFLNSALRSLAAGAILFVWTWARRIPLFERDRTLWPGIICGIFFAIEFLTLYPGLSLTQVARATIFLHCAPFVAAFGEHVSSTGHKLTGAKMAGLLTAFAGLAIALGAGISSATTAALTGSGFKCSHRRRANQLIALNGRVASDAKHTRRHR